MCFNEANLNFTAVLWKCRDDFQSGLENKFCHASTLGSGSYLLLQYNRDTIHNYLYNTVEGSEAGPRLINAEPN